MDATRDVMQVCRNGHIVTDRLQSDPASARYHCERCGASTMRHCSTCGNALVGARLDSGIVPIGNVTAPRSCSKCGAVFPWIRKVARNLDPLVKVEQMLRRLPLVIRELSWRHSNRPPYRIENERDLEDLLRALLQIQLDDVCLESRTPSYSTINRTDLILPSIGVAITVKLALAGLEEKQLTHQCLEDIAYYNQRKRCSTLVIYVYAPNRSVRDLSDLELAAAENAGALDVRCVLS